MKARGDTPHTNLVPALEAVGSLLLQDLDQIVSGGWVCAQSAHAQIELAPINQKSLAFYRYFLPWRKSLVSLLVGSYRQFFKLALAHPDQAGKDLHQWAWGQLQPAVGASLEWIRDWYVLACDGENQYVQRIASTEFVPGQTVSIPIPLSISVSPTPKPWCAPSWLFGVSLAYFGIGVLKTKNVPAMDSEERLGIAHTRLLLKGARRLFLWELGAAIERVRKEETAAAGAIPATTIVAEAGGSSKGKGSKHQPKGTEGLTQKVMDLSKWMHGLTEKQQMAFSLKHEYRLRPTEIAARMGVDRKTAQEHLDAAARKIDQIRSNEKRKVKGAKGTPEE